MTDREPSMVPTIRDLLPRVLFGAVAPFVAYLLIRPYVGSDAVGLAIVSVFPVLEVAYERRRHGRLDPVGLIVLVGLAAGLVGAVVFNGDATLLKLRESLVTGVFGLVCLASLAARRPVMFYLGRAFETGGDPEKVAEFDTRWEIPGVAWSFRLVTAIWGIALVAEAGVRTALALSLPTSTFLAVAPVVGWVVIGGLLWFTTAYSRAARKRIEARLAEAG
ncbi:MAG: hypothetical protein JO075_06945 [Acidimicrobiia bacterium]|nr:hypothetical protein [Acidimicrobiia bacterium]